MNRDWIGAAGTREQPLLTRIRVRAGTAGPPVTRAAPGAVTGQGRRIRPEPAPDLAHGLTPQPNEALSGQPPLPPLPPEPLRLRPE